MIDKICIAGILHLVTCFPPFDPELSQQNADTEPVFQSVLTNLQSGHNQPQAMNFPCTLLYNRCILVRHGGWLHRACLMSMKMYTTSEKITVIGQ
jgi:hypothetical protein